MRRQRTDQVSQKDGSSLMVRKFTCHDEGTFSALGSGVKESQWQIRVGDFYDAGSSDLEIKLSVDMAVIKAPKMRIEHTSKGKSAVLHPKDTDKQRDVLPEDFEFSWPFRGSMPGIGVKGLYECRVPGTDSWYPCRLDRQQRDGSFETITFQPPPRDKSKSKRAPGVNGQVLDPASGQRKSPGEILEVKYTTIGSTMNGVFDDIRFAATREKVPASEKTLTLTVPKLKPVDECCITCDDGEGTHLVTHYFARPTPCPAEYEVLKSKDLPPCAPVKIVVDKLRKSCEADVGHVKFQELLHGQPRFVEQVRDKLFSQWKFTVGLATHTVRIEKKKAGSKVVTLTVDDEVLVEAAARDVDGDDGEEAGTNKWVVNFKFIGIVTVDFSVYPTNRDSQPVGDTPVSKLWTKRSEMECKVALPDNGDCRAATITFDGMAYSALEEALQFNDESNLNMSPQDLERRYACASGVDNGDLKVPWETDMNADYGAKLIASQFSASVGRFSPSVGNVPGAPAGWTDKVFGMFSCFCKPGHEVSKDVETLEPLAERDNSRP